MLIKIYRLDGHPTNGGRREQFMGRNVTIEMEEGEPVVYVGEQLPKGCRKRL